jgi:hypothetical protein
VVVVELDELVALFGALRRHEVEYVLVGGVAAILLGAGRTTEDIDLFVRPTEANIAAVRSALRVVYPGDPSIDDIVAADLAGEYPTVRYGPPHGAYYIDLIARLGEAFKFDDLEWRELDVNGVLVRVATPRTLHRMKKGTIRDRDRLDAAMLERLYPDEVGD